MPKNAQEVMQVELTNLSRLEGLLMSTPSFPDTSEGRIATEAFLKQQNALKDLINAITRQNPADAEEPLNQLSELHTVMAMPAGNGKTVFETIGEQLTQETRQLYPGILQAVARDLSLDLNVSQIQKGQEFHEGPDLKHAWEDARFDTRYRYQADENMMAFLPNGGEMFGDMSSLAIHNDTKVSNIDPPFAEYDSVKDVVAGAYREQSSEGKFAMETPEQANTLRTHEERLSRELKRQGERREDEKIKRLYDDLSYIADPNNGNLSQAFLTSPYLFRIFSPFNQLVDPNVASSEIAKMDLGVPLYNATYDFMHAVTDELRTEFNRQRMEAEGPWTQEKEDRYLRELKDKHTEVVRRFDNLNAFSDTSDGRVKKHFSNTLTELFGRNSVGDRQIQMHTGMIRGELQAINNGWGSKELSILGMVGSMEQNLRAYENSANDPKNDHYREFKNDLLKLKNECFHTKVTTAQAKKEIADKVRTFIDTHDTAEAMRIMAGVELSRKGFDDACREVNIAAKRERLADYSAAKWKSEDPEAYLRDLEQKAVRSGNFSVYAAEVADVFAGKDRLPQDQQQALDQYWNTIQAKVETDHDFIRNFADAMAQNQVKAGAALEQAKQEMAGAIRDGREQVDPALSDVRHIPEAARLIAGQKLENSEMARQFGNAKNMTERMKGLFVGNPLANYDRYVENAEKVYANDPTDGLSIQEKVMYLELSKEEPGQGLEKYGVQQVKDPNTGAYTVTQAPTKQQVRDELNRISDAIGNGKEDQNISDYRNNLKDLQSMNHGTGDLLNRLERLQANRPTGKYVNGQFVDAETNQPLKRSDANSGAFMNMVEALKEVNALSVADNTPLQVTQALEKLDEAAEAYQQKIASQGIFGAWTSKGQQRLEMAGELREFVRQQRDKFDVYSNSEHLAPNEKIGSQAAKISVAIYDLNVAIQAEQNQARQNQANNAQPVNQNVANNAQPVNQNNAQQHAAPEQKRPGVREFATLDDFMQSLNTKQRPQLEEPAKKEQQRQRSSSIHQRQTGNQKQEMNQQPMQPGNI